MALPAAELDDGNGVGRCIELRVRDVLNEATFRALAWVRGVESGLGIAVLEILADDGGVVEWEGCRECRAF